jgi:hypothetical protein
MHAYSRWATVMVLAAGLTMGVVASHAAETHTDGHSSGESGGKGKGPKYMGGDRGSSHSSESHKGGSAHHDSSGGGSKSVESKIFHGKSGEEGGSHEDAGTEHTH